MRTLLLERALYPASAAITPFDAWARAQRAAARDFLPLADQERQRFAALRDLLAFAGRETRHYAQVLAQVGIDPASIATAEDWARLPTTTKADLRRDFPDRQLARSHGGGRLRFSNTSGTTGQPLVLAQDLADINAKYASTMRSRLVAGVRPLGSQTRLTPNECQPCDPRDGLGAQAGCRAGSGCAHRFFVLLERRVLNPLVHRRTMLEPFRFGPSPVDHDGILDRIEASAPDILLIYPLFALALAKHLLRSGRRPPRLPGIIDFSGGLCTPGMRRLIGRAFQRRTSQCCGGCEFARYAGSCPQDPDRMHLAEGHCYVEAVRPDGSLCDDDELGTLLVTSLHSRAMPVLRLEAGDVGRITTQACTCGRHSRRLQHEGRIQALLRNADGRWVSARDVWDALLTVSGVELFQLWQRSPAEYDLRLLPEPGRAPDLGALDEALAQLLGAGAKVRQRQVAHIEPEGSGKLQLVKSTSFEDFRVASARRDVVPVN